MSFEHAFSRTLVAQAATMRAAGASWADIARRVGRAADRVRHWPTEHPELWAEHYRRAERSLLADTACEARFTIRGLLRSGDERLRLKAGELLLKLRQNDTNLAPQADQCQPRDSTGQIMDAKAVAFARLAQELTGEQLEELLGEFQAYLALKGQSEPPRALPAHTDAAPAELPPTQAEREVRVAIEFEKQPPFAPVQLGRPAECDEASPCDNSEVPPASPG